MTTSTERESATIYQFPLRGRYAASAKASEPAATAPRIVFGTGWYHDEAIREAERVRRN
jgi:uncharacterized protein DUF2735